MQKFYSNGKLLLSGEYLILDGATGLALPTSLGQELFVRTHNSEGVLLWESLDNNGFSWFEATFSLPDLKLISFRGDEQVASTLKAILVYAKKLNPEFLQSTRGIQVSTKLQFSRDWGLGSSSTLISNIAEWSETNPFKLLFQCFGGSGYDIACAKSDQPILYELDQGSPKFKIVDFDPVFKDQLYFVHLNKKQLSSESIKSYQKKKVGKELIKNISILSGSLLSATTINEFNELLKEHESILGSILETKPVQQSLFPDYTGQIKSLGAWGGDFVLATGDKSTQAYFNQKGFHTVIPYTSMIKQI